MSGFKKLIQETHRRSLWQVLAIYVVAAWIGFQVIQTLTEGLGLPTWFPPFALMLFIIGLPVVLATAFVQEGFHVSAQPDPTLLPGAEGTAGVRTEAPSADSDGALRLLTWRNAIVGGVVAFALWGVIATGWLLIGSPRISTSDVASAGISSDHIAVLPFSYRGSPGSEYLAEGIVDLLSATLDGAGDFHSADARAVIRLVEQEGGEAPDPETAGPIARQLGAGRYVVGDVVEAAGQLRINAFLHVTDAGSSAETRASVEGASDEIFRLVDDLTAQLLAGTVQGPDERRVRLASVTTDSLAALEAYMEGEREYRAQRYRAAIDAFQRAVEIDPTFALAYQRLRLSASWTELRQLQAEASAHAIRLRDRLPERDRRLLEANATAATAEALLTAYVESYPSDADGWFSLADHVFHYAPLAGRSFSEARAPLERLLLVDPNHADGLYHLANIAAWEGKLAETDSLTRRSLELASGGDFEYPIRAARAFSLDDTSALEGLAVRLRGSGAGIIESTVRNVALFSRKTVEARGIAELLTESSRPRDWRGLGHLTLAYLQLAEGRWQAAVDGFIAAREFVPDYALEYHALLAAAPFLSPDPAELGALRDALLRWEASDESEFGEAASAFIVTQGLHRYVRLYVLGLVNARLGLYDDALQNAAELEQLERPSGEARGSLVDDFRLTIRAQVALERGDLAEALAQLERLSLQPAYGGTFASPIWGQVHTRFLLAEVLDGAGRSREALRWFGSIGQMSTFATSYRAPSEYRSAEIYERLGETEAAAQLYARFIATWSDCDPEFRPMVNEAERRLAQLTGEPADD
jgi:tetratricopeptide (TPR) repeat protein